MLKQSCFTIVIFAGIGLVVRSSSGVFIWLGLELRTLGFLGSMLNSNQPWHRVAKYLVFRAVGGALIFWGVTGSHPVLVWAGAWIKLGVPPFHIWVAPVVAPMTSWLLYFNLLFTIKVAPLWAIGWGVVGAGANWGVLLGGLALWGARLGLRDGRWFTKVALASTGIGAWGIAATLITPWLGLAFFSLYGASLYAFLQSGAGGLEKPGPLTGTRLGSFLLLAGLPPGPVFLAKLKVIFAILGAWGPVPAILFALSEFVSWAVYLGVLSNSHLNGTSTVLWQGRDSLNLGLGMLVLLGWYVGDFPSF